MQTLYVLGLLIVFMFTTSRVVKAEQRLNTRETEIEIETKKETNDTSSSSKRDTTTGTSRYDGNEEGDGSTTRGGQLSEPKKSLTFQTVGFGPSGLGNVGAEGLSYNFYAGRLWEVNSYAAVKATGEVTTDFDNAVLLGVNLGSNFLLIEEDISPYIGGELGFGFGRAKGDNALGFNLGGSLGLQLFRTSDIQMNVEAKSHILFNEIADSFPYYYSGRLGILF